MVTLLKKIPGLKDALKGEPAAIIGLAYSVVVSVLFLLHIALAAEIVGIAGPILAALHIRTQVFSPESVQRITDATRQHVAEARDAAAKAAKPARKRTARKR